MKKLIALALCIVITLSMTGCGTEIKNEDTIIMTATITNFGKGSKKDILYVTASDKDYAIYNWKDYIVDSVILRTGCDIEITYSSIDTEKEPYVICGVTKIIGK